MKHYKIDLTNKNNFKLLVLGDLHIGDELCDIQEIKRVIEYAKNTPDLYIILNGDLMNNALKISKSDSYRETMTMADQQDFLVDILTPIKDKILVLCSGNHEYRTEVLTGINPLRYVASRLGILDKYCDISYTLNLLFGSAFGTKSKNHYLVYGIHGAGGGRRIGGIANALEDMRKVIYNADLYVHSHTHKAVTWVDTCFEMTTSGLREKNQVFFNSNAFLKYGGYTERFKLPPSSTQTSVLSIRAERNKKSMNIITDIIRI